MARHKVKRYNEGDVVQGDITAKRVDLNNPGAYSMPMPVSPDEAAMNAGNASLGDAYMNTGPTPGADTDIGPQAPIQTAPVAPAAPARAIVSKKQLAESGFDNLRDYLNAQNGLKRKGESEARKPKSKEQKESAKSTYDERKGTAPKEESLQGVYPEKMLGGGAGLGIKAIANLAKGLAARVGAKEAAKEVLPEVAKKSITPLKFLGKSNRGTVNRAQEELANPQLRLGMKRGGHVKTEMKKSKPGRGDGIATKGHTKGRYL